MDRIFMGTVGGILVGGVAGYMIAVKMAEKEYEERIQEELEDIRTFYRRKDKGEGYQTPEEAVKSMHPAFQKQKEAKDEGLRQMAEVIDFAGYSPSREELEELEKAEDFAEHLVKIGSLNNEDIGNRPEPDYDDEDEPDDDEKELDDLDDDDKRILTVEEFMEADEERFTKIELTFYEGDDTLADEKDGIVPSIEDTIGLKAPTKFGVKSKDPNVVYVRNERLEADFSVLRKEGSYTELVLGYHDEDASSPRKFKAESGD